MLHLVSDKQFIDLPKKIGNGSVDGAVKSVIDLNDFPTS